MKVNNIVENKKTDNVELFLESVIKLIIELSGQLESYINAGENKKKEDYSTMLTLSFNIMVRLNSFNFEKAVKKIEDNIRVQKQVAEMYECLNILTKKVIANNQKG